LTEIIPTPATERAVFDLRTRALSAGGESRRLYAEWNRSVLRVWHFIVADHVSMTQAELAAFVRAPALDTAVAEKRAVVPATRDQLSRSPA